MDYTNFLAWLSPAERRAHELGAIMLGTSYDYSKTHGYQKYVEAMKNKVEPPAMPNVKVTQSEENK